jgi:hypothetical protein
MYYHAVIPSICTNTSLTNNTVQYIYNGYQNIREFFGQALYGQPVLGWPRGCALDYKMLQCEYYMKSGRIFSEMDNAW